MEESLGLRYMQVLIYSTLGSEDSHHAQLIGEETEAHRESSGPEAIETASQNLLQGLSDSKTSRFKNKILGSAKH